MQPTRATITETIPEQGIAKLSLFGDGCDYFAVLKAEALKSPEQIKAEAALKALGRRLPLLSDEEAQHFLQGGGMIGGSAANTSHNLQIEERNFLYSGLGGTDEDVPMILKYWRAFPDRFKSRFRRSFSQGGYEWQAFVAEFFVPSNIYKINKSGEYRKRDILVSFDPKSVNSIILRVQSELTPVKPPPPEWPTGPTAPTDAVPGEYLERLQKAVQSLSEEQFNSFVSKMQPPFGSKITFEDSTFFFEFPAGIGSNPAPFAVGVYAGEDFSSIFRKEFKRSDGWAKNFPLWFSYDVAFRLPGSVAGEDQQWTGVLEMGVNDLRSAIVIAHMRQK